KEEVQAGHFRADLYHRLSVYPIRVPRLVERSGDVQLLSGFFIEQTKRKLGLKQLKINSAAIHYLEGYDWPGNVRELEHVISRAALKAKAKQKSAAIIVIGVNDLGALVSESSINLEDKTNIEPSSAIEPILLDRSLKEATNHFQRQLIITVLEQEHSNWAAAARRLNTDRANLNRLAKRLNIKVVKQVV
ncbi:MAG: nitric oxide reductase transcription regulator, partial [Colwellia sp.]|nr:nitric oxide reductase transcription regulator [Colwellia sp.]